MWRVKNSAYKTKEPVRHDHTLNPWTNFPFVVAFYSPFKCALPLSLRSSSSSSQPLPYWPASRTSRVWIVAWAAPTLSSKLLTSAWTSYTVWSSALRIQSRLFHFALMTTGLMSPRSTTACMTSLIALFPLACAGAKFPAWMCHFSSLWVHHTYGKLHYLEVHGSIINKVTFETPSSSFMRFSDARLG